MGKKSWHPADARIVLSKPKARSRITNNKELLPGIDARSVWLRRFRDLNALLATDCGNGALSNGQLAIIRRASALAVECELLETKFARNHGATPEQLEIYIPATACAACVSVSAFTPARSPGTLHPRWRSI